MKQNDVINRFSVEHTAVRGQLISVDASEFAKCLSGHALTAVALPSTKTRH